jgi:arsenate reductase (glutaredoxin)
VSLTYFHNPRCSKSRQGLELLSESGKDFEIVEYLKSGVSLIQIDELLEKLTTEPRTLVRIKEDAFKDLNIGSSELTKEKIREIISANPSLLERPILVNEKKAVIGRPTENLSEIL